MNILDRVYTHDEHLCAQNEARILRTENVVTLSEDISAIYKSIVYFIGAKWPPGPQLSIVGSLDL